MAKRDGGAFIEFPEDEPVPGDAARAIPDDYRTPMEIIADAAIRETIKPATLRRMARERGIGVVVEVPEASWASEVEQALVALVAFGVTYTRTGRSKATDRADTGNERVAAALAFGDHVLGVSQAPETYLPSALMAAADIRVRIGPPSNRAVSAAIRAATGRSPRSMPPRIAGSLGLDELGSHIRRGSSPASCVRRIVAARRGAAAGDPAVASAPPLSQLAGFGPAMSWARQLVEDLGEWRQARLPWESISKNACLASEPGLGKTTFVRSLARETGLPLFSTSVSSWFADSTGNLDGVIKAAHRVMAAAAASAPSILFLDEVDAIPDRATMDNRGRDWWQPVVNGLLLALDATSAGPTSRVIVIGATNHVGQLDAALIRPGRLHPVLRIPRPDADALGAILRLHLADDLPGADLLGVARLAAGMSGADVVALVRDARRSARTADRPLALRDLVDLLAPADAYTQAELRACAAHESAHAIACEILGIAEVKQVSVALRTDTAGNVLSRVRPRLMLTRAELDALVVVTLSGRAQDVLTGCANTGAGGPRDSDLAVATRHVVQAHACYGLGGVLTHRAAGEHDIDALLRDDPALRARVEADLRRLYAHAETLIRTHRRAIGALADRLVAERVLPGSVVREIISAHPAHPARPTTTGTAHVH